MMLIVKDLKDSSAGSIVGRVKKQLKTAKKLKIKII